MSQFQKARVIQVAWGQNRHANSLATLVSTLTEEVPQLIKVEVIKESSIDAKVNVSNVRVSEPCWMDPIVNFLAEDLVLDNEKEAKRIYRTACIGCLKTGDCIEDLLGGHTFCASTPVKSRNS